MTSVLIPQRCLTPWAWSGSFHFTGENLDWLIREDVIDEFSLWLSEHAQHGFHFLTQTDEGLAFYHLVVFENDAEAIHFKLRWCD